MPATMKNVTKTVLFHMTFDSACLLGVLFFYKNALYKFTVITVIIYI